jgi:hypothetical protein
MRRTTPTSASWSASSRLPENPGVFGLMAAREEVTDDRRHAKPVGQEAEDERRCQAGREGEDQIEIVHVAFLARS